MKSQLYCLLLIAGCADVTSPEDYAALVESSRECSADDDCVLAGGTRVCTCAAPVHVDNETAVDDAAGQVECNEATIQCPETHDNLRCEERRCVSDQSP